MLSRAKKIILHPFFTSSAVMIVGTNLANFAGYIYHLIFGRLLGPSLYGELSATISLIGLFFVSFSFIRLVIVKFVSAKEEKVGALLEWVTRKSLFLGLIIALLAFLTTPLFSDFLHIKASTLILIGPIVFFTLFSLIYRSFLQGLLKFKKFVIVLNSEILIRLILGVIFVYLGFSVSGAVFAFFLGTVVAWLLGRHFLRKERKFPENQVAFAPGKKILNYSIPVFLMTLAGSSFYYTDIMLVKHFFSAYEAGIYASVSVFGRIISFASMPIISVMFPFVSRRHAKKQDSKQVFLFSLSLIVLIILGVLFVYWLFPDLTVWLLFGSKYFEASQYILFFGIFSSIFTVGHFLVNFYLSISKTKPSYIVVFGAVLQALGILLFHQSLRQVIWVSTVAASVMLVLLTIFGLSKKSTPRF